MFMCFSPSFTEMDAEPQNCQADIKCAYFGLSFTSLQPFLHATLVPKNVRGLLKVAKYTRQPLRIGLLAGRFRQHLYKPSHF